MSRQVNRRGRRGFGRRRDDRGAYAVLFSLLIVVVIAAAAIAVDIASLVSSKQTLKDTMDTAAHAAAFELPDNAGNAEAVAVRMAKANDPDANPAVDLWCVVASTGADKQVQTSQIPSTCNPGPGPYTAWKYPGLVCDEALCFIPCRATSTTKCNTVRVADRKTVPYDFAPAIGFNEGNTGSVMSVACKGTCGTDAPNPMDVVIMADRTASMTWNDRDKMKKAMRAMLPAMSTRMHAVALGTLHKSRTGGFTHKASAGPPQTSTDLTRYNGNWDGTGDSNGDQRCYTEAVKLEQIQVQVGWEDVLVGHRQEWRCDSRGRNCGWTWVPVYERQPKYETRMEDPADVMERGTWVPVPFQTNYNTGGETPVPNPSSLLTDGIDCLPQSRSGEFGTHLAAALKGAARYLLNTNTSGLIPDRPEEVKKVIIFETDGLPDEVFSSSSTALSLNNDLEIGAGPNSRYSSNGQKGCDNFVEIARQAKARGIIIITIGFGQAATGGCTKISNTSSTGTSVRSVLARAASPKDGVAATAGDCSTTAGQAAENSDGDYFFCSTNGSDLEDIFRTAFESVSGGIRFVKMPR